MLVYQRVNVSRDSFHSWLRGLPGVWVFLDGQVFGLFEESQNDPRQFFEPMRRDGELKLKAISTLKKNIRRLQCTQKRILPSYIWGLFHKPLIIRILIKHPG